MAMYSVAPAFAHSSATRFVTSGATSTRSTRARCGRPRVRGAPRHARVGAVGEHVAPVGQVGLRALALLPARTPRRVVAELEPGPAVVQMRVAVDAGEQLVGLLCEEAPGHAVTAQVMDGQADEKFVAADPDRPYPYQRAVDQIEGDGGSLGQRREARRPVGHGRECREVEGGLAHGLDRAPVDLMEAQPQSLMAGAHGDESRADGLLADARGQLEHARHVVGGAAGIELLEEPQALLLGESGWSPSRGTGSGTGSSSAGPPARSAPSTASASVAIVADRNSVGRFRSTSKVRRIRARSLASISEWPPRSKKWACREVISFLNSSDHSSATRRSVPVHCPSSTAPSACSAPATESGSGSADRSSLPWPVSGSRSRSTT